MDKGATVTIVNAEFCANLGLEVHSIDGLISVSVTGGANIPHIGYIVATLEFPHIPNYSECEVSGGVTVVALGIP